MKQACRKFSAFLFAVAFFVPVSLLAQEGKEKEKDKEIKEKKEADQIIITRKGNKDEKVVVEINGDKITVNGKPIEELKDGDVSVRRAKIRDVWAYADELKGSTVYNGNFDNFKAFGLDSNRAMLGVTTEKSEDGQGVEINEITKESAAAKAGLKEGDIITKIGDKKIENPDQLSAAIKAHKPGDKVDVTYLRDKKEEKASAELGKYKGGFSGNFKMDLGDMNLNMDHYMPRAQAAPRIRMNGQGYSVSSGAPKLGLSVQDTDDGKGVKIIDVDDESNAQKAGLKEDDIISEVDGKTVNSADEVAKIIRESKDKVSVMLKLQRGGKTQNIEVKIPRKLKTADL
jgi:serine protease Do